MDRAVQSSCKRLGRSYHDAVDVVCALWRAAEVLETAFSKRAELGSEAYHDRTDVQVHETSPIYTSYNKGDPVEMMMKLDAKMRKLLRQSYRDPALGTKVAHLLTGHNVLPSEWKKAIAKKRLAPSYVAIPIRKKQPMPFELAKLLLQSEHSLENSSSSS